MVRIGLLMGKSYEELLEASLPGYLRKDIVAVEEGCKNNSDVLDCLYNEVQGSNNYAPSKLYRPCYWKNFFGRCS